MFSVFLSSIGVNLCQSVDKDAKNAKGTKDAKRSFFCVLCKFLCLLWFYSSIGVNLCQSVDKNHRLAQIFSVFSANFCVFCGLLPQSVDDKIMTNLKTLTLILGGARSGKSSHALALARQRARQVVFVATAEAGDEEMAERIARHRAERPPHWETRELTRRVGAALEAHPPQADLLLLDDLTLLVGNVLLAAVQNADPAALAAQETARRAVEAEIEALVRAYRRLPLAWIVVSNEVGCGLVPATPLGRLYRDLLGRANQRLAAEADEVLLMVAGIPLTVKSPSG